MQQKQIYKMQKEMIQQISLKKTDLANFKSDPDKLDMDKCTK